MTSLDWSGFRELSTARLRQRSPLKWGLFGEEVLPLWVAEMDFEPAEVVQEAIRRAVELAQYGYAGPAPQLAEAFAGFSERRFGVQVNPAWTVTLPDVLRGVELGISAFSAPGSPVIVTTPAYMPFLDIPEQLTGRERATVPLLEDQNWALDLDGIDAAFAAGAGSIILCQPYNPTGRVFSADELRALSEVVSAHHGFVISDEIHAPLTRHGVRHVPYASVSEQAAEHTITVTAASKAFSIPGLSTALAVLHSPRTWSRWNERITGLQTHGASPLGIAASTAALNQGDQWLDACREQLDQNQAWLHQRLAQRLPQVGVAEAQGTYLAWLDFRRLGLGDDPARWLRTHAAVALNDGPTFGPGGEGFARMNLATSPAILTEAMERIERAVDEGS